MKKMALLFALIISSFTLTACSKQMVKKDCNKVECGCMEACACSSSCPCKCNP